VGENQWLALTSLVFALERLYIQYASVGWQFSGRATLGWQRAASCSFKMISFSNINKQYGKQLLFVDASFQLDALKKSEGTMIFVSHDRMFLRGLGSRVLELGGERGTDRHPNVYPGSYVEYVQKLGHEAPGSTRRLLCNGVRPASP
jgi:hypothetical protein